MPIPLRCNLNNSLKLRYFLSIVHLWVLLIARHYEWAYLSCYYAHIPMHTLSHTHTHTHTYTYTYTYTHIHIHKHTYKYTYERIYKHTHVCMTAHTEIDVRRLVTFSWSREYICPLLYDGYYSIKQCDSLACEINLAASFTGPRLNCCNITFILFVSTFIKTIFIIAFYRGPIY